ncbi:MAG: hypothetical protein QOJ25_2458 [Solirubrobacteraceae bacterium]|jgi:hypothetical protein|nr:hypothetical protein [Solirubrobacteraceae bacterium]
MKGPRKFFLPLMVVGAALGSLAFVGSASAAGTAVAQVEISGNCDNPSYCNTAFGGTGGLWIWAALHGGPTSGTTDYTFAGCGHSVGKTAPHTSGAGGGPGDGTWTTVPSLFAALADGAFPLDVAVSNGAPADVPYYELNLGGFLAAAPVPVGHYRVSGLSFVFGPPPPGVSFQTTVAP